MRCTHACVCVGECARAQACTSCIPPAISVLFGRFALTRPQHALRSSWCRSCNGNSTCWCHESLMRFWSITEWAITSRDPPLSPLLLKSIPHPLGLNEVWSINGHHFKRPPLSPSFSRASQTESTSRALRRTIPPPPRALAGHVLGELLLASHRHRGTAARTCHRIACGVNCKVASLVLMYQAGLASG